MNFKSLLKIYVIVSEDNTHLEKFTGIICSIHKIIMYFKDGKWHREDGPAHKFPNGSENWFLNGKRHRLDGPSVIESDGRKKWYVNNKLHREDGPAIEYPSGDKSYYVNGQVYVKEDYDIIIKLSTNKNEH